IAASPTASTTSASSMPAASASNRTSPNPSNGSAWRRRRAMGNRRGNATMSLHGSTLSRLQRQSLQSRPLRQNPSPMTPSTWRARPADGTRRRRQSRQSPQQSRFRSSAPPVNLNYSLHQKLSGGQRKKNRSLADSLVP